MMFDIIFCVQDLCEWLLCFMDIYIYFNEVEFYCQVEFGECWVLVELIEEFKFKVCVEGLWNFFLLFVSDFEGKFGVGLINFEYVGLCEIMGWVWWVFEVFNCNVFDIGNMEVIVCYGMFEQQEQWFFFLLNGEICLVFFMIELQVVSSDVINIEVQIVCDGDEYVINGCKWWFLGVGDLCCKVSIFMGKIDLQVFWYL